MFPDANPEHLSFNKSNLVQNGFLGFLAMRTLGLQRYIFHGAASLQAAIAEAEEEAGDTSIAEFASKAESPYLWDPVREFGYCS